MGHTRGGRPRMMLVITLNPSHVVVNQALSLQMSLLLASPLSLSLPPKAAVTPRPPDIFWVFLNMQTLVLTHAGHGI